MRTDFEIILPSEKMDWPWKSRSTIELRWLILGFSESSTLSQLYGSTTVVMATHGVHWKWQSLTPCQRHPSEPIEKIFGMIDNVIDLNNLAKFGFGKIFPDGGTHTQHIRVRPFLKLFTLFDDGAAETAEPILTRDMSIAAVWWESDSFLEIRSIGHDLDLEKVKIRYFVWPSKFWPEFSRKRYEIERKCQ